MLIDRYLPAFDVSYICETSVNAPPDVAYAAIRETNLRDPVIDLLFELRGFPERVARRLRGEPPPPAPEKITFGDLAQLGPGWVSLAEEPGVEFVVGSVGQLWRKDYGRKDVAADAFTAFMEPGYAKVALGFAVRPAGRGAIVRYEARTATTDEAARRKFRLYWRVIAAGVGLVMRRALRNIKAQAERHALVSA